MDEGRTKDFRFNGDGILCFQRRICVPKDVDQRQDVLREAHSSSYAMHPSDNKMYCDLHELYWWFGLKREVTEFCPTI